MTFIVIYLLSILVGLLSKGIYDKYVVPVNGEEFTGEGIYYILISIPFMSTLVSALMFCVLFDEWGKYEPFRERTTEEKYDLLMKKEKKRQQKIDNKMQEERDRIREIKRKEDIEKKYKELKTKVYGM